MNHDEPDHMALADAMACGLSAVLLLFFAVVIHLSSGTSNTRAVLVLEMEFEFAEQPDRVRAQCTVDSEAVVTIEPDGTFRPSNPFDNPPEDSAAPAPPPLNVLERPCRLYRPPAPQVTGLSLSVGRLPKKEPDRPCVWKWDISFGFPGKPRDVAVEVAFRAQSGTPRLRVPDVIRLRSRANWLSADARPKEPEPSVNRDGQKDIFVRITGGLDEPVIKVD